MTGESSPSKRFARCVYRENAMYGFIQPFRNGTLPVNAHCPALSRGVRLRQSGNWHSARWLDTPLRFKRCMDTCVYSRRSTMHLTGAEARCVEIDIAGLQDVGPAEPPSPSLFHAPLRMVNDTRALPTAWKGKMFEHKHLFGAPLEIRIVF